MGDAAYHRFAWDGVTCEVPCGWELSEHRTARGVTKLAMEDDDAVRLQFEWLRPRRTVDRQTVLERYLDRAKDLAKLAKHIEPLPVEDTRWVGHAYRMDEERSLIVAYYQSSLVGEPFAFLLLHFDDASPEDPIATFRHLARTFQCQAFPDWTWTYFDVSFKLDMRFRLTASALEAGRKLLVFRWGLRRLFVWHFSLADMIRERQTFPEFAAQSLNGSRAFPAAQFSVADDGELAWQRKRRYPIGHMEEIGRWCFRYHAGLLHLPERNQLAVWVFNFRNPHDLTVLQTGFDPR
jgi:hypothetical protein